MLPHSFQIVHNADSALLLLGLGNGNHVTQAPHSFTLVVDRKANVIIASTSYGEKVGWTLDCLKSHNWHNKKTWALFAFFCCCC